MEDNESQLFKILKSFLYAFMIGAVYYAGGYGYALLFTKDEEKRDKVAKWNLIALVLEILLILVIFAIYLFGSSEDFGLDAIAQIIKFMMIHTAISLLGSVFYVVSWISQKRS